MWVVHFTDKNGKATVSVCQSRDAALKSARGLRQHFCVPASRAQACTKRSLTDIVWRWASQMRAVLSRDAVTMRDPSGLKAAEVTSRSWPRRTAISLPLAASHTRAVLSRRRGDDTLAVGAKGGGSHLAVMAAQDRDLLAARGVPDARSLVR